MNDNSGPMPTPPAQPRELDPVCGMKVDPARCAGTVSHKGKAYYFCGKSCIAKFQANPDQYLKPASTMVGMSVTAKAKPAAPGSPAEHGAAAAPNPRQGNYTCPMDPEVIATAPGPCPKCGMALEPVMPAAGPDGDDSELHVMRRRFWIALALTLPVVALAMGANFKPTTLGAAPWVNWVLLAFATPVVIWAGAPFFVRGWRSVRTMNLNMFTLIALGVGVAYGYSVAATVAPGIFPPAFRNKSGAVETYFEAAAAITVLLLLGQMMELGARSKTGAAIRSLLALAPKTARRVQADGSESDVPLDALHAGDILRVRPGEKLPADGVVIEGSSVVDESMMSGEATPIAKASGAQLIAGSVNGAGGLLMRAEKTGADTMLAQIVDLVAAAQRSRAPIQKLADRVSGIFVPAVLAVAVLTFIIWSVFGPPPAAAYGLINAVAVLMIACPCALGLATPISIVVGVGRAARDGILIKDAAVLERLEAIDTVAIDKTGTLTRGQPTVVSVFAPLPGGETELLAIAAALERSSEHPLGAAIIAAASERNVPTAECREFQSVSGKGVRGNVNGMPVALGNAAMMTELQIDIQSQRTQIEALQADGQTVIFAAMGSVLGGFIGIADPLRPEAIAVVAELKKRGLQVVMITGDSHRTAATVAAKLGITDFEAAVLPAQKHEAIERLEAKGRKVAMVGDGINDAAALAQASVGIAMGTGTDVAIANSGITLLHSDLRGVIKAMGISRAVMRNIRQNLFFAFIYNIIGVPIAAGILYPFCMILLSPIIAAAAMSLSSVSVISNALRLRTVKLKA